MEKHDISEKKRIEKLQEVYNLKTNYNVYNPYICETLPLMMRNIPEISPKEHEKFPKFKIEIKKSGSRENKDEEYSITEYLYWEDEGEWKTAMYNSLGSRRFDRDHGKINESLGTPLQRVIHVDIEDLVYYIEDERMLLYCSLDKIRWLTYNTTPEKRPYHDRIDKLRKIKIIN